MQCLVKPQYYLFNDRENTIAIELYNAKQIQKKKLDSLPNKRYIYFTSYLDYQYLHINYVTKVLDITHVLDYVLLIC
jgi:hypothetical protein